MELCHLTSDMALFALRAHDSRSEARLTQALHEALCAAGKPPWLFAEAELYETTDREALLLLRRRRRVGIAAADWERVLALLPLCPAPTALYARAEDYLLVFDSRGGEFWLWDWGRPQAVDTRWELLERGQGHCLSEDAGREILPLFSAAAGRK